MRPIYWYLFNSLCSIIKKEACAAFLFIKKILLQFYDTFGVFRFFGALTISEKSSTEGKSRKKKPWTTMHFEEPNLTTNFIFLFPALLRSLITPTNKQGLSYVLLFGTSVFFIEQNVPTLNLWWKNNLHTRQSHFSIFLPFTKKKQKCMCL